VRLLRTNVNESYKKVEDFLVNIEKAAAKDKGRQITSPNEALSGTITRIEAKFDEGK
jgi:hypothetical protein